MPVSMDLGTCLRLDLLLGSAKGCLGSTCISLCGWKVYYSLQPRYSRVWRATSQWVHPVLFIWKQVLKRTYGRQTLGVRSSVATIRVSEKQIGFRGGIDDGPRGVFWDLMGRRPGSKLMIVYLH